ncbi:MAG TPA: hypothetical protein DEH78_23470, partial [Solibacterales bacterium]|nr:hypothetical protein [Bryobacterales bacterium]
PSRWRIAFPQWRRYEDRGLDAIYARGRWWDPYNQRVLKGDFPIFGREYFLNFQGSSETTFDGRRIPTP